MSALTEETARELIALLSDRGPQPNRALLAAIPETEIVRTEERAGWQLTVAKDVVEDGGFFARDSELAKKYGVGRPAHINAAANRAIRLGRIVEVGQKIGVNSGDANPGRYFEGDPEEYTSGKGRRAWRTPRFYDFRACLTIATHLRTNAAAKVAATIVHGFARAVETTSEEVAALLREIVALRTEVADLRAARTLPAPTASFGEYQIQERERMLAALHETRWNRSLAAATLGMPRRTFYRRVERYGISLH